MCCFQQFVVVVPALAFAPFGMPATAFWIYVCALLLFIIGLIKIFGELPQEHGVDKIMPFGRLFFAIPLAVFGSEHFTAHGEYCGPRATLDSRRIRFGSIWWASLFLARRSVSPFSSRARLAAALVGMTLLIFVFVMDLPAVVAHPGNRFFGLWP